MGSGKANDPANAVRRRSSRKSHSKKNEDAEGENVAADVEAELKALRQRNAELEDQLREAEAEIDSNRVLSLGRDSASRASLALQPPQGKQRSRSVAVSMPFKPQRRATESYQATRDRISSSHDGHELNSSGDMTFVERRRSAGAPAYSRNTRPASFGGIPTDMLAEQIGSSESGAPMRRSANIQSRINNTVRKQLADLLDRQREGYRERPLSGVGLRLDASEGGVAPAPLGAFQHGSTVTNSPLPGTSVEHTSTATIPARRKSARGSLLGLGARKRRESKHPELYLGETHVNLEGTGEGENEEEDEEDDDIEGSHRRLILSPSVNYDDVVDEQVSDTTDGQRSRGRGRSSTSDTRDLVDERLSSLEEFSGEEDDDVHDAEIENRHANSNTTSRKKSNITSKKGQTHTLQERTSAHGKTANDHAENGSDNDEDDENDQDEEIEAARESFRTPRLSRQTSSRMTSFMVNVSRFLTAYHKTVKKDESKAKAKRQKQHRQQSMRLGNLIHYLPRGGVVIQTTIGYVQFGMPPETVKDSMTMGLEVPEIYVVPRERFNLSAGVNVCEIEFPAFFNFFIRRRKTTLVTHREAYEDLLIIMTEALNGPPEEFLFADKEYSDFCPDSVRAACPDHAAEIFHFRAPNRKPGQNENLHMLDIDMLLEFKFFDAYGVCDLGNGVMVFDDEENVRFELVDAKMQEALLSQSTSSDDENNAVHEDAGVLVPYRVAESCTVPISGGLVPRMGMDLTPTGMSPSPSEHGTGLPAPFRKTPSQDSLLQEARARASMSNGPRTNLLKMGGGRNKSMAPSVNNFRHSPSLVSASASLMHRPSMSMPPTGSFIIPKFGLTVLGNSHGFDKNGSTSGFVLWVNGQGVMVDPPPHSTSLLFEAGIPPNSITALILTHCHADHDAGTFQKMITEHKITLMTTTTIFESFKRKYAAVSGLKPEFIEQLVNFRPVFLEEPNYWNGASIRFFYSLHSIPCVGFQATFEGKDVVYSADTFYDPDGMRRMHEDGILSEARLNALLGFPWHCDVVLHEAGVPPIHTPLEALATVPDHLKKNVRLIHIDGNAAARAAKLGFRIAEAGVDNTIVLIPRGEDQEMLKFLQLIGSIEIFRHFEVAQAIDLMLMAREVFFPNGGLMLEKGTVDERFMIILEGRAIVQVDEMRKFYRAGDFLGELAAWKQSRMIKEKSRMGLLDRGHGSHNGSFISQHGRDLSASESSSSEESEEDTAREEGEMLFIDDQIVKETVIAETDVRAMVIDKYALNYLLMNDPILRDRLEIMIHARLDGSWEAISLNTRLRLLSSMQKTQLQGLLSTQRLKRGDKLWRRGDPVDVAVLIARGTLIFEEVHGPVESADLSASTHAPLSPGMLIFDYYGCHHQRAITTTLVCLSETASIFVIDSISMMHFLDRNPMILLALLKSPILI